MYIGQTWESIQRRFRRHCEPKANGCSKLHRALNKYDKNNFSVSLLTICHTQSVADYWETYFIRYYDSVKNGYNIRDGGNAGKLPISTRRKMSQSRLGKKRSEETKRKLSLARKGMRFSEEHRKKLSVAASKITEERKRALSKMYRGKTWKIVDGKRVWITIQ